MDVTREAPQRSGDPCSSALLHPSSVQFFAEQSGVSAVGWRLGAVGMGDGTW